MPNRKRKRGAALPPLEDGPQCNVTIWPNEEMEHINASWSWCNVLNEFRHGTMSKDTHAFLHSLVHSRRDAADYIRNYAEKQQPLK